MEVRALLPLARIYRHFSITRLNTAFVRFPTNSDRFNSLRTIRVGFLRKPIILCKSACKAANSSNGCDDDFVTRVLKENPSQVKPRFKVGDKVLTLTEKQRLKNKRFDSRGAKKEVPESVHLKDILRVYGRKLYVPEQMFRASLFEEEEFDQNFEDLPRMEYDEFVKFMKRDKVKTLTLKEQRGICQV